MLLLSLLLAAAPPLVTLGERSAYTRTGRYAEVESLCAAFPKAYPGRARCERFGTTPEGRPMLALVAGQGALTPEAAKARGRPVVLLQGGIHAGEIDGKDAGFKLLRDLLEQKALLDRVTVVFVPVFNVDGHERFGAHNRPNQRGPEEMGWRTTAQNLNLNRDATKADAPETLALLGLLNRWDPLLYADLHVTDGAKFQHDVAVLVLPRHGGPAPLRAIADGVSARVQEALAGQGHLPLDFYPAFEEDEKPESGFGYGVAPPRFSTTYWAFRNRLGVLVETHSWRPYAERVQATYDVCRALLEQAAANGAGWRAAMRQVEAQAEQSAGLELELLWEATKASRTIDFQGYAYTREDSPVSGQKWLRYDASKPQVWKVPFHDQVAASLKGKAPRGGWLVPPAHAEWLGRKLLLHQVRFEVLKDRKPSVEVESFRATEAKFRSAPYEGRLMVALKGEWKPDRRDVEQGALWVPAAQANLFLAMHLLEPYAPDSFASWGFFNAHFEQKEYMEDYVAEEVAREQLKDPEVKQAFEAKLKAEPEFAKAPAERLKFFYRRHASWDERLNLYPVFRAAAKP